MDLVAIRLPGPLEADSDGNISLDAVSINAFSAPDFQFTIETRRIPDDIANENVETHAHTIRLAYERTLPQEIQFHRADVATLAKFTQANKRVGAFSLSMSQPMFLKRTDLICQGQSGSPVFGMHDGVKSLTGILVKGRHQQYLDDRWCGSALFTLRMDAGGMAWITRHVR